MASVTAHTDSAPSDATRTPGAASASAPATTPTRPGVAPTPATSPSVAPGQSERRGQAPKPSGPSGHGVLPRLAVLLVLVAAAAGLGWWALTTQPWIRPAAPLTASGTLEADEILVGTEVSGKILGLAREGDAIEANTVVARLD